jgi:hypothetical protein
MVAVQGRARIAAEVQMQQTASGLLVLGWKLALALLAGIPILTTIGVFLLARFTHILDAHAEKREPRLSYRLGQASHPPPAIPHVATQESIARDFTEVQMTCARNFATVQTLRKANTAALPVMRDVFLADVTARYESLLTKEQLDAKGPQDKVPIRTLLSNITAEMMTHEAQTATDSAALVFAHSILDDAATQYCRIAAALSPSDWASSLSERKLSLSDFKTLKSYEAAVQYILGQYLGELQNQSLVTRIKLLNRNCQPMPDQQSGLAEYKLNLETIEALDKKRQDIIHRTNLREPCENIEADIDNLFDTCRYLGALVSYKYGVKADEGSMDGIIAKFRPPRGSKLDVAVADIVRKARE